VRIVSADYASGGVTVMDAKVKRRSTPTSWLPSKKLWWVGAGLALALVLLNGGAARAADDPSAFDICTGQTYALCATAHCYVLNDVAYCKCNVEVGDSISEPFSNNGQDICSINAEGAYSGYMASTYSLPASVVAPYGHQAVYTCPGETSDGAYAQCDGGVCFTSTEGQSFPGFDQPLAANEIICSCPMTVATPPVALGYQITGPFPCQESFFANCNSQTANTNTGSRVYVGAPSGVAKLLTRLLDGSVPQLNECRVRR
jgi:hypothetical protein